EIWMVSGWICRTNLAVLPYFLKPSVIKYSARIFCYFILKHIAYSFREPLRLEDHNVLKALVVAVVYYVAEIMHKLCQCSYLRTSYSVVFTHGCKLLVVNLRLRLRPVQYLVTSGHPTRAY